MSFFKFWRDSYLSNPQVLFLVIVLVIGTAVIALAGGILAPLITSLVIAYILDGGIDVLQRLQLARSVSLLLVYLAFIFSSLVLVFVLVPMLTNQVAEFLNNLPAIFAGGKMLLMRLPEEYPEYIKPIHINQLIDSLRSEITGIGTRMLSLSLSSVVGFITVIVYVVLVPLLIFFFLKDKRALLAWFTNFMPRSKENHRLTMSVWSEVNAGIAGYIRGKLIEILIVWGASWIIFFIFDLDYAPLLSFLVGISVLIPFLGAAIVAIPVALVAYAQWGFDASFIYVMIAYAVLQFLDGNLLVPLLFSEIVNLHPVAIISSVLVFGGIWGIWGVFFAIPLATLVNAVSKALLGVRDAEPADAG